MALERALNFGGAMVVGHRNRFRRVGLSTLFAKSDGSQEKVLAIRGTEPGGLQTITDVVQADLGGIGLLGMALSQAVSMVNHISQWR